MHEKCTEGNVRAHFSIMETQGLLTRGHAVGLVEDDNLVTSRGQCHFVLSEHFDFATDNINATLVRRIELEHAILDRIAQHFAGEGHETRCLAETRRACKDHVRHVAVLGNGSQTLHRVLVSNHIVQLQRPVFFHPGSERASPWKKRGRGAHATQVKRSPHGTHRWHIILIISIL